MDTSDPQPMLPDFQPALPALSQGLSELNELSQQMAAAMRPVIIEVGRQIKATTDYLDRVWPGWREFAASVPDWEPEPERQACHCLCAKAHGGFGVCTSEADPGLFRVRYLHGQRVDIAVCRACEEAALAYA